MSIETHAADIETDLRRVLGAAGCSCLRHLPLHVTSETRFGPVAMPGGGRQSGINPRQY
jgi:hypothetical protein